MLDVLHVLFEEDLIPQYEEHLETRSKVRTSIYKTLYGETYKYQIKPRRQGQTDQEALGFDPTMELPDIDPIDLPTKPFIEPTDPADLPGLLKEPPLR